MNELCCIADLARQQNVPGKIAGMFKGEKINSTENRAVLHPALRSERSDTFEVDGHNVVPDVHAVLDKIRAFSNEIRRYNCVAILRIHFC